MCLADVKVRAHMFFCMHCPVQAYACPRSVWVVRWFAHLRHAFGLQDTILLVSHGKTTSEGVRERCAGVEEVERVRHTGRQLARSLGLPDLPPPAPLLWQSAGHPKLPSSPALQDLSSQLAHLTASLRWVPIRLKQSICLQGACSFLCLSSI